MNGAISISYDLVDIWDHRGILNSKDVDINCAMCIFTYRPKYLANFNSSEVHLLAAEL